MARGDEVHEMFNALTRVPRSSVHIEWRMSLGHAEGRLARYEEAARLLHQIASRISDPKLAEQVAIIKSCSNECIYALNKLRSARIAKSVRRKYLSKFNEQYAAMVSAGEVLCTVVCPEELSDFKLTFGLKMRFDG